MDREKEPQPKPGEFEFTPAQKYPDDLRAAIESAERRIILQSMAVSYDEATAPILESVIDAQQRGVETGLLIDDFSNYFCDEVSRLSLDGGERRAAEKEIGALHDYRDRLTLAGGFSRTIHPFLGKGRRTNLLPWAGRNHVKLSVVDDEIWSFGGVNFTQGSFANHDYMLHTESPELAGFLQDYTDLLMPTGRLDTDRPSLIHRIDKETAVIIDTGLEDQSAIYDLACDLAEQTDGSIRFVSQMAPQNRLCEILETKQKELGADAVQAVHNSFHQFENPAKIEQYINLWKSRLIHDEPVEGFIHAKYMIFTNADGHKTLITGSHNFNERGVHYGTAEIALVTTNPELIGRFESYTDSLPVR